MRSRISFETPAVPAPKVAVDIVCSSPNCGYSSAEGGRGGRFQHGQEAELSAQDRADLDRGPLTAARGGHAARRERRRNGA
jgi:hypothetical protein